MFNEIDILLTSNPDLLLNKYEDKILIKYETQYNKHIPSEFTIKSLSEFEEELKKINYNV
jgi:ABC-type Fe3+ transport system substrate-binding protein